MSLSFLDLALYAGALFVLFLTPGPVWLAVLARGVSSGFAGVWPLALGVALGDVVWPLVAVFGVSWIGTEFVGFLDVLRWVACVIFVWLGVMVIRHADMQINTNSHLTRPGVWAGFLAGLAAILGNPKAILFYIGVLPGFFDLSQVTTMDMIAIGLLSAIVPLMGNLGMGLCIDRMRQLVTSKGALARLNRIAGTLLIAVGIILPFT
jgi:threonine/homoserine/homoserine lactone efflux protein